MACKKAYGSVKVKAVFMNHDKLSEKTIWNFIRNSNKEGLRGPHYFLEWQRGKPENPDNDWRECFQVGKQALLHRSRAANPPDTPGPGPVEV